MNETYKLSPEQQQKATKHTEELYNMIPTPETLDNEAQFLVEIMMIARDAIKGLQDLTKTPSNETLIAFASLPLGIEYLLAKQRGVIDPALAFESAKAVLVEKLGRR